MPAKLRVHIDKRRSISSQFHSVLVVVFDPGWLPSPSSRTPRARHVCYSRSSMTLTSPCWKANVAPHQRRVSYSVMPRLTHLAPAHWKRRGLTGSGAAMILLIVCALGCRKRQRELAPGVSDSTYVAVIAQLEQVQRDSMSDDSTRRTARQNTFTRYKVSPEAIEEASATLASDPQRALKLWQAIDRRFKASTPPTPRSATAPPSVSDMPIPPRPAPKQPRSRAASPAGTTAPPRKRSVAPPATRAPRESTTATRPSVRRSDTSKNPRQR